MPPLTLNCLSFPHNSTNLKTPVNTGSTGYYMTSLFPILSLLLIIVSISNTITIYCIIFIYNTHNTYTIYYYNINIYINAYYCIHIVIYCI